MGIRYVAEFCGKLEYIVKIDDDTLMNIHDVVSLMEKRIEEAGQNNGTQNTFLCRVQHSTRINRYRTSKWFVLHSVPLVCQTLVSVSSLYFEKLKIPFSCLVFMYFGPQYVTVLFCPL